jgi:hypothetical protein
MLLFAKILYPVATVSASCDGCTGVGFLGQAIKVISAFPAGRISPGLS